MKLITYTLFALMLLISSDAWSAIAGWTQRTNFGSHGRHRGCAISIGTKGYMGLGHYNGAGPNIVLADWWEFDPASNSWTQKADYTGNSGNGNYAVLAFGMSQYGYVGGGQVGSDPGFYRYDPATNAWTAVASTPTSVANLDGFEIGTKGYYVSGNQLYEYDSVLDSWTLKNPTPFSPSVWHSTFAIDGKGYMKTGASLWEYKPSTDQWAIRASFPGLASAGSVSFSQFNKGYIVTGYQSWLSNVTSEVWEFNPATNTWAQLPEFPGNSRRFSSGFSIGNRSYMGIGTNGTNFNDFWEFNSLEAYASLAENVNESNFTAYPNPAIETVNFKAEKLNGYTITIFDQLGKKVGSTSTLGNSCTFTRDGLPSGTYSYTVMSENEIIHQQRFIFN
jgi:N-acetylneuraminic acid mutarotase